MKSIYTKRFSTVDTNGLCIVQFKGLKCRVFVGKNGKWARFPDFKVANRKIWHIEQAGADNFEWTAPMLKSEFYALVQARLLREELAKSVADKKAELEDRAELDREYRRMKRERDAEACGPMELEDSEEDFDDDSHDDGDDNNRGW